MRGFVSVRIDDDFKNRLKMSAKRKGISMNAYLLTLIEYGYIKDLSNVSLINRGIPQTPKTRDFSPCETNN